MVGASVTPAIDGPRPMLNFSSKWHITISSLKAFNGTDRHTRLAGDIFFFIGSVFVHSPSNSAMTGLDLLDCDDDDGVTGLAEREVFEGEVEHVELGAENFWATKTKGLS